MLVQYEVVHVLLPSEVSTAVVPHRASLNYLFDRFVTENSTFHVPEATLGLGLAGGLSYVLPRLLGGNQPLALCLALTGMAIEGADLLFTQMATNYIAHRRLDMMLERLAEVRSRRVARFFLPGGNAKCVNMKRYAVVICFYSTFRVIMVNARTPQSPLLSDNRIVACLHRQINQDPKPFGDRTPDCSEDPTAVQTLVERSGDLSWNIDGLPSDCLDPTEGRIPVTSFVHEVLPQVKYRDPVVTVPGAARRFAMAVCSLFGELLEIPLNSV